MKLHFKPGINDVKEIRRHNYSKVLIIEIVIDMDGKTLYVDGNYPNMLVITDGREHTFNVTFIGDKELNNFMKEVKDKL
jgi:hypothetical protein